VTESGVCLMKYIFLFMMFFIQLIQINANELVSTQEDLDAAFVFLISKNTTWPDEKNLHHFRIGVVDDNRAVLKAFQKLTKDLALKNKDIVVNQVDIDDIATTYKKYQVLFVGKKYKKSLSEILKTVPKNFPLLLISKECEDKQHYMINLYEDKFNKINIQVNLEEIHQHNLTVSNEIILAGGKKVGISKLFESSLRALQEQEKSYKQYVQQNRDLKQEIQRYKQNISKLQTTMDTLHQEISSREQELKKKLGNIEKKDKELEAVLNELAKEKQTLLKEQKRLNLLQSEYKGLNEKLAKQKELMDKQKSILKTKEQIVLNKQKEIQHLDKKIEQQRRLIVDKVETIEQQGMVLYLLIVIVVLMILFAIYFYRTKNKYELLSKELALAKESADYANHSKSVFLANMSHELRTPLNAILGFSQLLSKDKSISKSNKKTIGSIYRAGAFLLSLINDVLDLSRIEAGKLVLHEEPTDIKLMLHDIFAFVKSGAEKKGIRLLMKVDPSVPQCVLLDGDKLRQIILNYLTNAIKYSDSGNVNLSIKASSNRLYISVKDEGQGIKESELETIFQPFVQVGSASEHTGTGLGLTITQKYAQSMGGKVSVESQYGKGSTFYAEVEYGECQSSDIPDKEELREIVGVKPKKALKMLVIDDKEDNRELLKAILSQENCEIILGENGLKAIELFEKFHPDIIWMDRKMPLMNGEEASRKIRQLPGGDKVVIIGITASVFKEDEEKLIASGMNSYILKPYDVDKIYKEMAKYCELSYIYKDDEKEESKDSDFSYEEFVRRLGATDKELLEELYNRALLLDKDEIESFIKEKIFSSDASLARMLSYLVEEMQYNVIIKNISNILEG
jgi:signal transduction histidine kinase/DNA-binding response OmpR family regulator